LSKSAPQAAEPTKTPAALVTQTPTTLVPNDFLLKLGIEQVIKNILKGLDCYQDTEAVALKRAIDGPTEREQDELLNLVKQAMMQDADFDANFQFKVRRIVLKYFCREAVRYFKAEIEYLAETYETKVGRWYT
jgi:hypothetical protein